MKKLFFKAKCYGWGWYPCSWEGWLILLIWFLLFLFFIRGVEESLNLFFIFVLTLLLILICWKTGEKPRWRWGK